MVSPLIRLLVADPGLLQQVEVDVAPGQLAQLVEVDADELALCRKMGSIAFDNLPNVVYIHVHGVKKYTRKLTNLDELSFLMVLALP